MAGLQPESLIPQLVQGTLTLARLKSFHSLAFNNAQNKNLLVSNGALEAADTYWTSNTEDDVNEVDIHYLKAVQTLCVNHKIGRERIAKRTAEFDVVATVIAILGKSEQKQEVLNSAVTTLCAVIMNNEENTEWCAKKLFEGGDVVKAVKGSVEENSANSEFLKKV